MPITLARPARIVCPEPARSRWAGWRRDFGRRVAPVGGGVVVLWSW